MSRRIRLIVFVGLSGLIVLIGLMGYGSNQSDRSDPAPAGLPAFGNAGGDQGGGQADTGAGTDAAAAAQAKADLQSQPTASRYFNNQFGFSFEKPEGYTVGVIPGEDGSQILLVQNLADKSNTSYPTYTSDKTYADGFQIFITPLDEPVELTPDFIQKDLPGTLVKNALAITLGDPSDRSYTSDPPDKTYNAKGIMFESNNEAFGGKSFEVWFIAQMADQSNTSNTTYIFQVSSYAEFADQLKAIIGTWKFN